MSRDHLRMLTELVRHVWRGLAIKSKHVKQNKYLYDKTLLIFDEFIQKQTKRLITVSLFF